MTIVAISREMGTGGYEIGAAVARIEHRALLRPGGRCTLQLPTPSGLLVLSAQVIWTAVVGQKQHPEGQRNLRYHSGLLFVALSPAQERAVASLLERLHPEVG